MKIAYIVLAVIIVTLIWYYLKQTELNSNSQGSTQSGLKPARFDSTPDLPMGFGYKNQWFAIKTEDTQAVINALGLVNVQVANWRTGIEGANEGHYFVAPPSVGGRWSFIQGYPI